ncbi:hypothetical protein HAALTHF_48530n [Vreelandella aquamarina]|nr:hypothetical protein HAALTHF_48530n [Halomonas axialensis]
MTLTDPSWLFQPLKQRLGGVVALGAWLMTASAIANDTELPKGHFLLPESGNMVGEVYTVTAE